MAAISAYHRPATIDEAVALLGRTDVASVALGGGTVVSADIAADPFEVVDLQALGLDGISGDDGSVRIGATARLQSVVDSGEVPALIRDAARREAPNTIRNAATIGGAVATADAESGLVAALLVHGASVEMIGGDGPSRLPLPALLADRAALGGAIITAVSVETGGESSWAGTGRTPADTPIVAAYARVGDGTTRLALTGVASTPILVEPENVGALAPPADFRGSTDYRRTLATVLAARVLGALGVAA